MSKQVFKNTMTQEQINEMLDWFHSESETLRKDIYLYNEKHDYYHAAKCEGVRDSYIRCIHKLNELKNQTKEGL